MKFSKYLDRATGLSLEYPAHILPKSYPHMALRLSLLPAERIKWMKFQHLLCLWPVMRGLL